MNGVANFLNKIPDEKLLICGDAGEYWTDLARFASAKPKLLPPAFRLDELKDALNKIDGGFFDGLYITWGLSRLLQDKILAGRLFSRIKNGGVFLGIELLENDKITHRQKNHADCLRLFYETSILSKTKVVELLSANALTDIRTNDLRSMQDRLRVKDFTSVYSFISAMLKSKRGDDRAAEIMDRIEEIGLDLAPVFTIEAVKGDDSGAVQPVNKKTDPGIDSLMKKILESGADKMTDVELLALAAGIDAETAEKIMQQLNLKSDNITNDAIGICRKLGLDDPKIAQILAVIAMDKRD